MKAKDKGIRFIPTPLGTMRAMAGMHGILSLSFHNSKKGLNVNPINKHPVSDKNLSADNHLNLLENEINQYFTGKLKQFTVSLDLYGTDFQKKVWNQLLQIDFGETITYLQQAHQLNDPKAIRAMASANGQNPVALIVPCHRVIGSNGNLTGYAGGLQRKKCLLEFEKLHSGKAVQMDLFHNERHEI